MFYYGFHHIIYAFLCCVKCRLKKKRLKQIKNAALRREKLYELANKRLIKDLDVVTLLRQFWKFEILSSVILTPYQLSLLEFQRTNVIEEKSEDLQKLRKMNAIHD